MKKIVSLIIALALTSILSLEALADLESLFLDFQAIATNGAGDWESFTINGETYLAVANVQNDSTYNTDSKIYQFYGQPEAKSHSFIPLLLLND